ncbi:MHYT domain-containing protein [Venatoribacter cucullus]|uniref:MHYT domain-containing protein n=1 Tax=Venatoribacter cucullus TaxID=2661630 RepID=UPI00223F9ADF|nr:MHYT domain-containing protein [Venatoribacter cucullus]
MTLNDWFVPPGTINHLLPMEHNHGIVLLSVLIAILTSAMALQIAGLARLSRTRSTRHLAIATGAISLRPAADPVVHAAGAGGRLDCPGPAGTTCAGPG